MSKYVVINNDGSNKIYDPLNCHSVPTGVLTVSDMDCEKYFTNVGKYIFVNSNGTAKLQEVSNELIAAQAEKITAIGKAAQVAYSTKSSRADIDAIEAQANMLKSLVYGCSTVGEVSTIVIDIS